MASNQNNPRKFSEKIAQHIEKQRQETEAFEQIMKEVMGVQSRTPVPGQPPGGPGELPKGQQQFLNINNMPAYRGGSLPDINNMPHHHHHHGDKQQGGQMFNRSSSPRNSRNSIGPIKVHKTHHRPDAPYASPPSLSMLNSAMAGGNSGSNLCSQGMYTTNYLSPPGAGDAPWRRANSDSALHSPLHSLMIPSVVPDSSEESSNNSNDPRDNYGLSAMDQTSKQHDPNSVIPNTVGDGPNLLEIPSSVSTGSLPDLTNFQFTPPLQGPPLDAEDSQLTNSPYSTSPISLTYSPTGGSPHPPPNSNNSQQQQGANQRTSQPHHQHQQQQQQHSGNNQVQQQHQQQQQQQHQHQPQVQQQQQPIQSNSQGQQQQQMMDNPINVNVNSFQNFSQNDNMLTAYRCPPRPSPLNSPLPFRSPSPLDGQFSAPSSPGGPPQILNSAESYFNSQQANALQQHFEQITVGGGMVNNSPYFYNTGQQQIGQTAGMNTQQSPQHHQPHTPQTPTSIPDIIFTDFSEDLLANEAQALRDGLGPIDMDGFNMLADPDLVQLDPSAEDSFRLDRL